MLNYIFIKLIENLFFVPFCDILKILIKKGGKVIMILQEVVSKSLVYQEMSKDDNIFFYDLSFMKFLHNIDTFYYSIKLKNDLTVDSVENSVLKFRKTFDDYKKELNSRNDVDSVTINVANKLNYNLLKLTFGGFYNICLEKPEEYDVFIAPIVPKSATNDKSVTTEIIVQIRSYLLWTLGVTKAYEKTIEEVKELLSSFNFEIDFVQENRTDFAWHTNYFLNPEKFFQIDNLYNMRVDRFKDMQFHTVKSANDGYEIDYVSAGKRSDKVFLRIYHKTKEVIEQSKKSWFFYIWFFNKLINRYDLYVYEECFKKGSYKYLDVARLSFYAQNGKDDFYKELCKKVVENYQDYSADYINKLADDLTPKVTVIYNIEFQVMRKHTKSYDLVPFKDNSDKGESKRIYDFFDNRRLIMDYLTFYTFRLVDYKKDPTNKSRCPLNNFWDRLRKTKIVDVHLSKTNLKLTRTYSKNLNADLVKAKAVNAISNYSMYLKGATNESNLFSDCVDFINMLNDNDIMKAKRNKSKKRLKINVDDFEDAIKQDVNPRTFSILNLNTGELY